MPPRGAGNPEESDMDFLYAYSPTFSKLMTWVAWEARLVNVDQGSGSMAVVSTCTIT